MTISLSTCLFSLLLVILCNSSDTDCAQSTIIRHVQVLFRHGDRAPLAPIFPNDPINNATFWPHGFDQLTTTGRARMYRLGQMLRAKYSNYLGDDFSPREVSARSSAIDRCLESAQLVLAGAYPPNSTFWQWDLNGSPFPLGRLWQPVPVASFLPAIDDSLLRTKKSCPKAEAERESVLSTAAMTALLAQHRTLLREVSSMSGAVIEDVLEADRFHENLNIELENGYYWSDHLNDTQNPQNWTQQREQQVLQQLEVFSYARWNNEWNTTLIKRVRAGELLVAIGNSFHQKRSVLDLSNDDQNKLMLYSSHDTKVAAVLFALNLWNGILIPYSTAIIFELHQSLTNQADFYVSVQYYNETMSLLHAESPSEFRDAYHMTVPACVDQSVLIDGQPLCPLDRFTEIVQGFHVDNWNQECGIDTQYSNPNYLALINFVLLLANLIILFALLLLVMYFYTKIRARGYRPIGD